MPDNKPKPGQPDAAHPINGASVATEHGFIETLARRLRAFEDQHDRIDRAIVQRGGKETRTRNLDAADLAGRDADAALEATWRHCDALHNLILRSRAETMADAIAQAMIVSVRIETMVDLPDELERAKEAGILRDALQGAVRAMAQTSGISLTELSGRTNASVWCDPWPVVDVSDVSATVQGVDLALDERGRGYLPCLATGEQVSA